MKIQTRILTEVIAAVALSGVLHLITLYQFPQGGRITAAAMVPVLFVALRRGPKIGILAGIAFGLVVLIEEPFIFHPLQVLFDYPLAYGALGLAGFFRRFLTHCASAPRAEVTKTLLFSAANQILTV